LLFNKTLLSDVSFDVNGTIFHAHKAYVMPRCPGLRYAPSFHTAYVRRMSLTMTTTTNRARIEAHRGDESTPIVLGSTMVDGHIFRAVLQYIYTDHCPIEDLDPESILAASDRCGSYSSPPKQAMRTTGLTTTIWHLPD